VLRRVCLALVLAGLAVPGGADAAKRILPGFHSPSGNIRCYYRAGRVGLLSCHVGHALYAKRLTHYCASPPIGVDSGGFELTPTRRGAITCTGGVLYEPDTERPVFANLPYGTTWRRGVFTCVSRLTGVTCMSRSDHGLFVSRQSWRAW
jgi:hypothetical protein